MVDVDRTGRSWPPGGEASGTEGEIGEGTSAALCRSPPMSCSATPLPLSLPRLGVSLMLPSLPR